MSRWKTAFNNLSAAGRLQGYVESLKKIDTAGLSSEMMDEYARLLRVLGVLNVRLSKVDPELFGLNTWSVMPGWLHSMGQNVLGFVNTKNMNQLQNLNSTADAMLDVLRPLDIGPTVEEFKSIADANHHVQEKLKEEIKRGKSTGDEVKIQLDSLSKEITNSKARLEENNQEIQQHKKRLDDSIAQFQSQFSQAQEKRTKDFADSIKAMSQDASAKMADFETHFHAALSGQQKTFDEHFVKAQEQSTAHLNLIKQREADVNKIYGAIGATSLSGDFKTTAELERRAANVWRRIAFTFMALMAVGAGVVLYYTFKQSNGGSFSSDWVLVVIRYGTIVVLAVPAFYAAKESAKHRERERQNKKIGLELASIDAYLVLLPEPERNKIKGNLTEKFFGVPILEEKSDDDTHKEILKIFAKAVDNLTKNK